MSHVLLQTDFPWLHHMFVTNNLVWRSIMTKSNENNLWYLFSTINVRRKIMYVSWIIHRVTHIKGSKEISPPLKISNISSRNFAHTWPISIIQTVLKKRNTWPWQEHHYLSKLLFILQAWSLSCKRTFSEKSCTFEGSQYNKRLHVKLGQCFVCLWWLSKPLDQSPNHVIMMVSCISTSLAM